MNQSGEWWIFTFGYGQKHAHHCVKIKGTFSEAREKMLNKYGNEWAFQYSLERWKEIEADPNRWWEMEKLLEVIE